MPKTLKDRIRIDEQDYGTDINRLYGHKYLFVGFADESLPELRHEFPGSLFMNTDNYVLTNVKVDAIIFLIRYMSHGMMYKIRAHYQFKDIPVIICKGRRLNSIFNDMLSVIERV